MVSSSNGCTGTYEVVGDKALTDAEMRVLIYEATRLKNGRVRLVVMELNKGSVKITPLVKAA